VARSLTQSGGEYLYRRASRLKTVTRPRAPFGAGATVFAISARCRFIASVLQAGRIKAAGYKLAGDGHDTRSIQDYLGHKNIQTL
jgi:hypothetical protein